MKNVETNDIGEITEATLLKGKSRESLRRHSSVIIFFLTVDNKTRTDTDFQDKVKESLDKRSRLGTRQLW